MERLQRTADGGFITAGTTFSNDGDVSGLHSGTGSDGWIVKLTSTGATQWQKCYGANKGDEFRTIQQTTDGGYIAGGLAGSNGGDVQGFLGGVTDAWIVKIDANGAIQWQKCLGGDNEETVWDVQQTIDGGYAAIISTNSVNANPGSSIGGIDVLLVKLDATGNIVWQRTLGGGSNDFPCRVRQTSDGGYVIAATTFSNDGDAAGNHGFEDFLIMRLDGNGNTVWKKLLGGRESDEVKDMVLAADGSIMLTGVTDSPDGDVSGLHGFSSDVWVVKLGAAGNILWQKCFGGIELDYGTAITATADGGFIVGAFTSSADQDVCATFGDRDCWLLKITAAGVLQWQRTMGGSDAEFIINVHQTPDGGYITGSLSNSSDRDVIGNQGNFDFWVVKLGAGLSVLPVYPDIEIWSDTNNVCPGTDITFKTNVVNAGAAPTFNWQVNGVTVFSAGNIFTTGSLANGDIVRCIMTSSSACATIPKDTSNSLTIAIQQGSSSSITLSSPDTVCSGLPATITATATNSGPSPSYQWSLNGQTAGDSTAVFLTPPLTAEARITCVMKTNTACPFSNAAAKVIAVVPKLEVTLPPRLFLYKGESIQLSPVVTGTLRSFSWTPTTYLSNPASLAPVASPLTTTTYNLTVVSAGGCTVTKKVEIEVETRVTVPNVFTPNGDGTNDTWIIKGLEDYPGCKLQVFNRYGQPVFQSKGYGTPWNGNALPVGAYYYILDRNGKLPLLSGAVTIIR